MGTPRFHRQANLSARVPMLICAALIGAILSGCVAEGPSPPKQSLTAPSPEAAPSPQRHRERLGDGAHGAVAAGRRLTVAVRRGGQDKTLALDTTNPLGQRLVFLVVDAATDGSDRTWLKISTPERPNGSTGWVRRNRVEIVRLRHRIEIDLSEFRLRHFRNDKLVDTFKVGIGQTQYPTPKGRFYIWARVPQPSAAGPYGIYALGISGFSPVLSDWPGGGRSAIHGTADATDPGARVSHGCIRVFNGDMEKLTKLPMGTPVIIRR